MQVQIKKKICEIVSEHRTIKRPDAIRIYATTADNVSHNKLYLSHIPRLKSNSS